MRNPKPTRVINIATDGQPDIYIGRPSIWGNPFKIGRDGDRLTVIAKYAGYLTTNPALMAHLPELRGRTLGCWCKPEACHGDVLAALADDLPDTHAVPPSDVSGYSTIWGHDDYMSDPYSFGPEPPYPSPVEPVCPVCGSDPCQWPCVDDAGLEAHVEAARERELIDALVGYDPHDALVGFERLAVGQW